MEVFDAFGKEIKEGNYVIFNLSGVMAAGYIQTIKPFTKYGRTRVKVLISVTKSADKHITYGHVSTVQNLDCIAVINND